MGIPVTGITVGCSATRLLGCCRAAEEPRGRV